MFHMTSPTELRIAEQRDYKVAQYGDTKKYMKYKGCTVILTQNLPLREHIHRFLMYTSL